MKKKKPNIHDMDLDEFIQYLNAGGKPSIVNRVYRRRYEIILIAVHLVLITLMLTK
jgi:hypothetical protein